MQGENKTISGRSRQKKKIFRKATGLGKRPRPKGRSKNKREQQQRRMEGQLFGVAYGSIRYEEPTPHFMHKKRVSRREEREKRREARKKRREELKKSGGDQQ